MVLYLSGMLNSRSPWKQQSKNCDAVRINFSLVCLESYNLASYISNDLNDVAQSDYTLDFVGLLHLITAALSGLLYYTRLFKASICLPKTLV
jgi:hypothetical protein